MATVKDKSPIKVAGHSYYLMDVSNTGLFKGYVIDPGSTGYAEIQKDDIHSVLLTHGHNDHFRKFFRGSGRADQSECEKFPGNHSPQ